MDIIGRKETVV